MNRFVRSFVVAASLATVLGGSTLAQAFHIRSIVDRKQHPNGHFFVQTHHPQHQLTSSRVTSRSLLPVQWLRSR